MTLPPRAHAVIPPDDLRGLCLATRDVLLRVIANSFFPKIIREKLFSPDCSPAQFESPIAPTNAKEHALMIVVGPHQLRSSLFIKPTVLY